MKDPGTNQFLQYMTKKDYKIRLYDISSANEIARINNF